jgi:hypothetical protein
MSTYLEMYVDALKQKIDDGGTQAEIDAAVNEYNSFDQVAFERWLSTVDKVTCASCGALFKPSEKPASAEILCKDHVPQ